MYSVVVTRRAERELEELPEHYRTAMVRRLLSLRDWPVSGPDIRALHGSADGSHRLRVGPYRAILDVWDERKKVTVVRVGHRSRVYQ